MLEPWELDENWAGTIDENDLRRWMSKAPVVRMTHRKISVLVLIGFLQEIDVIPLPAKGILHSKTHGEFRGRSFALATYQHALCKLWTKWKPSGLCDEPTVTNLSSHLPGHQGDGWVARSFCNWPSLVCLWFAYSSYILHILFIIIHYYSLLSWLFSLLDTSGVLGSGKYLIGIWGPGVERQTQRRRADPHLSLWHRRSSRRGGMPRWSEVLCGQETLVLIPKPNP